MIDNERDISLGGGLIHATHHSAPGQRFVVVAPPLFEEHPRLRKVLVNASRYLCDQGHNVVRFDYTGTGYSPGQYEDVTLERAQADLEEVIDYCRGHSAAQIHVIGVRFGGYLVLRALEDKSLGGVVVWEPIVDPAAYIKEVLRSEVATQMLIYGEVRQDRDRMVERIRAEGRLHVEGYCISRDLYDQLADGPKLSPDAIRPHAERASFVYWQSRREHKRWSTAGIRSHWVEGVRLAYNHIRHLQPRSEPLYRQTLEELR